MKTIWLRRGDPSNPVVPGAQYSMMLSEIGNAAARETLVTATSHMAAIWTDLFDDLILPNSPSLRWRGDGPGIGRDARIAYSSLLGRYMARAYLTEREGVRVLVPLDEAKRRFKGTRYVIEKDPLGRGLEADWIGLDDYGLVIVEAKGTFDSGIKTWRGPRSEPQILRTAVEQVERTAVFRYPRRKLPAKRWAIASRWGTEENRREPTLLAWVAWDSEEEQLDEDDYQELYHILHSTDVDGVLGGMGHPGSAQALDVAEQPIYRPEFPQLRIGDQWLEPGFAAMVGPFGVHPLRTREDRSLLLQLRDLNLNYAVASLSHSYISEGHRAVSEDSTKQLVLKGHRAALERFPSRLGLTVVWPSADEDVSFEEE